jgi:hypothetical protein
MKQNEVVDTINKTRTTQDAYQNSALTIGIAVEPNALRRTECIDILDVELPL